MSQLTSPTYIVVYLELSDDGGYALMHCPGNFDGKVYVELVAAVSILLSEHLNALQTFILAEFLDSVSDQMFVLGAFKESEEQICEARARKEEAMVQGQDLL